MRSAVPGSLRRISDSATAAVIAVSGASSAATRASVTCCPGASRSADAARAATCQSSALRSRISRSTSTLVTVPRLLPPIAWQEPLACAAAARPMRHSPAAVASASKQLRLVAPGSAEVGDDQHRVAVGVKDPELVWLPGERGARHQVTTPVGATRGLSARLRRAAPQGRRGRRGWRGQCPSRYPPAAQAGPR